MYIHTNDVHILVYIYTYHTYDKVTSVHHQTSAQSHMYILTPFHLIWAS